MGANMGADQGYTEGVQGYVTFRVPNNETRVAGKPCKITSSAPTACQSACARASITSHRAAHGEQQPPPAASTQRYTYLMGACCSEGSEYVIGAQG